MKLKRILHKALVGVGIMIVAMSILGAKEVLAVCNISSPPKKTYGLLPSDSFCNSYEAYSASIGGCDGSASTYSGPDGWLSLGKAVYSCGSDNKGPYCYCHVEACNTGCGATGEEEIVETCGNYSQPACQQGVCLNGKVCVGVGNQGACGCSNGASCSDYVGDVQNLRATRLTSTSARIQWSAPSTYQYVNKQRLAIAKNRQDALNCSYNNLADPSNLCVVDVRDLPKTVGSYDTSSVLTPGYQYYVVLTIVAGGAPGAFAQCKTTDNIQHLSSCELTPNPTTVAVGADATMTTSLAQSLWSVAYSRSPASKATVTTPDTTRAYTTTVHGVADGATTVTTRVTYSAGGAEMCSDTATVNVGCSASAPTAPTLVSPSNGASLTNLTVPLDWSPPTWGAACPANSNRYLVYADPSPSPTTLRSTISTPINSPTSNYNFTAPAYGTYYWKVVANNGSLTTSSVIRSFTVAPAFSGAAWWQVSGAGIYSGSDAGGLTIKSEVPTGNYLLIPGSVGSVAALMRSSGTYETGSGSLAATNLWNTLTKYKGKEVNYASLAAQMGVVPGQGNDIPNDIMDKPTYEADKDFYYIKPGSGIASLNSDWSVTASEKYVIFVDGNLTINQNITVANGGYLMFIVSGDIAVEAAVATMQGIYLTSGVFTTEKVVSGTDVRLVVSGSVVAWGGVSLNRDLGSLGNSVPAEQFVYRPDLLMAMPKKVKTFVMEWQEVTAGTYNN